MSGIVTAKCRKCGKSMPTTEFVLDPIFGAMVCAACSKERKTKESMDAMKKKQQAIEQEVAAKQGTARPAAQKAPPPQPAKNRPAGWDAEDDYLEKLSRAKQDNIVQVKRIDRSRVQYKCPKCHYDFPYNLDKQKPSKCPFCNTGIFKFIILE